MVEQTVSVGEFPSRDEAQIAAGMLRANGLAAVARLEDAGGAYPQLAARVQGGTSVHVPLAQADLARELLEETAREPVPPGGEDEVWRPARVRYGRWVIVGAVWGLPLLAWLLAELTGPW